MPYCCHYCMVIRDTFNVFLAMVCGVEKHVQAMLEWDVENWQVLNVCLACCYLLEGEPVLCWSRMLCPDGNNSLKCIAPTAKHQQGNMMCLKTVTITCHKTLSTVSPMKFSLHAWRKARMLLVTCMIVVELGPTCTEEMKRVSLGTTPYGQAK